MSDRRPIKSFPEIFRQQGREEGREEARKEVREENARTMFIETSMDNAMVAKLSGLDEARVAELRQKMER